MTVYEYYKHARSLGAFPAHECLRLAREAVALDDAAWRKRHAGPVPVCAEMNPDGTYHHLSFTVLVF